VSRTTTNIVALVAGVVALVVAVGRRLSRSAAWIAAPAKAQRVPSDFQRLAVGQSSSDVIAAVGPADEQVDNDWFYRLDENSGYLLELDADGRLASVRSWKS
jgi:hypothetical protein